MDNATDARRARQEFGELQKEFGKLILPPDSIQVALSPDALDGIAKMIAKRRNAANARHIARSVVRDGADVLTTNAQKNQVINRYFELINSLDEFPDGAVSQRLYADMGKYLNNSSGFIKGMYHQLEFMDELRQAGRTVESLEKGFGVSQDGQKSVKRFVDITADGNRHFETKNFAHYTGANVTAVTNGLEKEIGKIVDEFGGATIVREITDELDKIHFVFRGKGNLGGAEDMLKAMEEQGVEVLKHIDDIDVKGEAIKYFEQQIEAARAAINNSKTIPELGDLVVFQGKDVPYSL